MNSSDNKQMLVTDNDNCVQLLNFDDGILYTLFEFLDNLDTLTLAVTCTRLLGICISKYPISSFAFYYKVMHGAEPNATLDTPSDIAKYLNVLSECSCGICGTINSKCNCMQDAQRCDDCGYESHAEMLIHTHAYDDEINYSTPIKRCRFGCNWYCGFCNGLFETSGSMYRDDDGVLICAQCIHNPIVIGTEFYPLVRISGAWMIDEVPDSDPFAQKYPDTARIRARYAPNHNKLVIGVATNNELVIKDDPKSVQHLFRSYRQSTYGIPYDADFFNSYND